jgi:hypothetical protein
MAYVVYARQGNGGFGAHYDPLGNSHECVHEPKLADAEEVNKDMPIGAWLVVHS